MEFEQEKLDKIVQQNFYFDIGKKIGLLALAVLAFLYIRKKLKKLFSSLGKILPTSLSRSGLSPATGYSGQPVEQQDEEILPIMAGNRKPRLLDQMQMTAKGKP
ncbi:MAG: hypothetical protein NTV06_08360, partial [candidate division Zixibacteria bacterium]|nr:hypothetical protein [candidate division Zixibacteria bacterium]